MKVFTEWMNDRNATDLGSSDLGLEVGCDADLVSTQVNDWITKLVGLLHDVPTKNKKAMAEQIAKAIRTRIIAD